MSRSKKRGGTKERQEWYAENVKLTREISDLEDALILHERLTVDDQSSLRGVIRQELGGSRWQYGGSGKLHTFRTKQDLADPHGLSADPHGLGGDVKVKKLSSRSTSGLQSQVQALMSDIVSSGATGPRCLNDDFNMHRKPSATTPASGKMSHKPPSKQAVKSAGKTQGNRKKKGADKHPDPSIFSAWDRPQSGESNHRRCRGDHHSDEEKLGEENYSYEREYSVEQTCMDLSLFADRDGLDLRDLKTKVLRKASTKLYMRQQAGSATQFITTTGNRAKSRKTTRPHKPARRSTTSQGQKSKGSDRQPVNGEDETVISILHGTDDLDHEQQQRDDWYLQRCVDDGDWGVGQGGCDGDTGGDEEKQQGRCGEGTEFGPECTLTCDASVDTTTSPAHCERGHRAANTSDKEPSQNLRESGGWKESEISPNKVTERLLETARSGNDILTYSSNNKTGSVSKSEGSQRTTGQRGVGRSWNWRAPTRPWDKWADVVAIERGNIGASKLFTTSSLTADANKPVDKPSVKMDANKPIDKPPVNAGASNQVDKPSVKMDANKPIAKPSVRLDSNKLVPKTSVKTDVNKGTAKSTVSKRSVTREGSNMSSSTAASRVHSKDSSTTTSMARKGTSGQSDGRTKQKRDMTDHRGNHKTDAVSGPRHRRRAADRSWSGEYYSDSEHQEELPATGAAQTNLRHSAINCKSVTDWLQQHVVTSQSESPTHDPCHTYCQCGTEHESRCSHCPTSEFVHLSNWKSGMRDTECETSLSLPADDEREDSTSCTADVTGVSSVGDNDCDSGVAAWLAGLGLKDVERYQQLFGQHEIDMSDIPSLTVPMLKQMGVTTLGAIVKMVRGIDKLHEEGVLSTLAQRDTKHSRLEGETTWASDVNGGETTGWLAGCDHDIGGGEGRGDRVKLSYIQGDGEREVRQSELPVRASVSRSDVTLTSSTSPRCVLSGEDMRGEDDGEDMRCVDDGLVVAGHAPSRRASWLSGRRSSEDSNTGKDTQQESTSLTAAVGHKAHRGVTNGDATLTVPSLQLHQMASGKSFVAPIVRSGDHGLKTAGRNVTDKTHSSGVKGYSNIVQPKTTATAANAGVRRAAQRRGQRIKQLEEEEAILRRRTERFRQQRDAMAARYKQRQRSRSVERESSSLTSTDKEADAGNTRRRRLSEGELETAPVQLHMDRNLHSKDAPHLGQFDDEDDEDDDDEEKTVGESSHRQLHRHQIAQHIQQVASLLEEGGRNAGVEGKVTLNAVRDLQEKLHHLEHSLLHKGTSLLATDSDHYRSRSAATAAVTGNVDNAATSRHSNHSASLGDGFEDEVSVPSGRSQHASQKKWDGSSKAQLRNTRLNGTPVISKREKHSQATDLTLKGVMLGSVRIEPTTNHTPGLSQQTTNHTPGLPQQTTNHTPGPSQQSTNHIPEPSQQTTSHIPGLSQQTTSHTPGPSQQMTGVSRTQSTAPHQFEPALQSTAPHLSMTKRQLLDEIRREKDKHRQSVRHLKSELTRLQHNDPVKKSEIERQDIVFSQSDLVGEGAFSQVFRGQYQGAEVAIKRLNTPLSSHDKNYFAAEVSLLRDLRHPRVVLLIGVSCADRLPIMVLEFMAGGDLYALIHDPRRSWLDHAEFYQIARDVSSGMVYLHNHRPPVLHLDLKSMNVLLTATHRAKIGDFGFSKLKHDADKKAGKQARKTEVKGSPAWMAPELLTGGEVTPKADVFSFGVILWEMVSRKHPYEGCSVYEILEQVRTEKRPDIPESCPLDLENLITQCWEQNPAARPNFKEVLKKVEQLSFPPDWRALFEAAGVPHDALEDVASTRQIISLVTSTLDSSGIAAETSQVYGEGVQSSASSRENHTPGRVRENHTPGRVRENHTPGRVRENHTPGRVREKNTPGRVRENHTPGRVRENESNPEQVRESMTHSGRVRESMAHPEQQQQELVTVCQEEKTPRDSLESCDHVTTNSSGSRDTTILNDSLDTMLPSDSLEEVSPRSRSSHDFSVQDNGQISKSAGGHSACPSSDVAMVTDSSLLVAPPSVSCDSDCSGKGLLINGSDHGGDTVPRPDLPGGRPDLPGGRPDLPGGRLTPIIPRLSLTGGDSTDSDKPVADHGSVIPSVISSPHVVSPASNSTAGESNTEQTEKDSPRMSARQARRLGLSRRSLSNLQHGALSAGMGSQESQDTLDEDRRCGETQDTAASDRRPQDSMEEKNSNSNNHYQSVRDSQEPHSTQNVHISAIPPPPPPPPPTFTPSGPLLSQRPVERTQLLGSMHQELLQAHDTILKSSAIVRSTDSPRRAARKKRNFLKERFHGNPHISVEASALLEQKGQLKSAALPHPNQLRHVPREGKMFSSIADLLRKAMVDRRFAMGEKHNKPADSQDLTDVSWSLQDD